MKISFPCPPEKIILVGLNYRNHASELNMEIPEEPVIFLKPPSALVGQGADIIYPPQVQRLDYEAELAIVVKKEAKNISEKKIKDYILGYTCLNDITARDLQKKDGQWTRAKSFDTFCPAGPHIETKLNPDKVRVRSYLNGALKQESSTSDFIFPVPFLFSFISRIMTLKPGDIISTGTPPGVGPMEIGDKIKVEIDGIGCLENQIR